MYIVHSSVEEGLDNRTKARNDSSSDKDNLGAEIDQGGDLSVVGVALGVGNDVGEPRNGPGQEQRSSQLGVVQTGDPASHQGQSGVLVELHVGLLGTVESLTRQLQLGLLGGHRGVGKQQGQGGLGLGSPVARIEGLEEAQNGVERGGGNDVLEVEREGHFDGGWGDLAEGWEPDYLYILFKYGYLMVNWHVARYCFSFSDAIISRF
ncbi:uncharacterized protein YALI1_E23659g [Yarrowia lipolytica]|uniref:Uncharacterized protein n=1 Tax=Yarrowia lipolytica TaxID=4952 RepID=A0A1D8NJ62_YARLL|nr:hypothetical protein YALI1_E23659g [Yarrowia lipolytica]